MADLRLARLPTNWNEQPETFRRWWDETMNAIEETLNAILSIPEIEQALEDLDVATQAAQDAADNANAAASAVTSEQSLSASFPQNYTPPLLNADDTGLVTIAAHDRKYGDGTVVSVTGGTVATGLTSGDIAWIYYDQASRAGGAVTYQFTQVETDIAQTGDRHSLGAVTIPASGSQAGNPVRPPGYVNP